MVTFKSKVVGIIVTLIGFAVFIALAGLLSSIPIYYLWNWLMPDIFGLKQITLWQALGINVLSSLLFKNFNTTSSK